MHHHHFAMMVWLWLWFFIGTLIYWLKRAYYLVSGPNPVANSYAQFIQRCWVPLLVRMVSDSVIFWLCFTPQLLAQGLKYLGWESFSGVIELVTQFAPVSFLFGNTVDSIMDVAISKVPFLKGWLPQMPMALPSVSPTDRQVAAQVVSAKAQSAS
jgi:hypothetical protein